MKTTPVEDIDRIVSKANVAFLSYRKTPAAQRAAFLRDAGKMIDAARNELARIAARETNLDTDRLNVEIDRTVNQCYLFAELLSEGSWVRAIIDTALPDRKPLPRPDLRQMQVALGPVAVFGASNFPFAYSVFGGDTVAAQAAGCPVVYKVNPGHPDTSDAVAEIIVSAANKNKLPEGIFDIVHGAANETGERLVMHPAIKAVGFTGSLRGGRALFDAAGRRSEPIPVYAEMGSTNPVFILPRILEKEAEKLAQVLYTSNTSGAGQFCTKPGIMITPEAQKSRKFSDLFAAQIRNTEPKAMLNEGILQNFTRSIETLRKKEKVKLLQVSPNGSNDKTAAYVFHTSAAEFLGDEELSEEMFGPGSLQVSASGIEEMMKIAEVLPGQITTSVWGTDDDLREYAGLIEYLQLKAGRIIINGVPTGVEVTAAMNHGGPYPATTDSKFTSVGTESIYRFTRPVCFQNYPDFLLPPELQNNNPRKIVRKLNGKLTDSSV